MSTSAFRTNPSTSRRLQFILLLLILWDILALAAELSFGSPLFEIEGNKIDGLLAGRGSFSGAAVVPIGLYIYAFVRGPVRHRNILWVAVLEQVATALFTVFHVAAGDLKVQGMILPVVISLALAAVILTNLPRNQQPVA